MTLQSDRPVLNDPGFRPMQVDNVPRERYFSQEFSDLERERLWRRVWQPACRLEEIPKVGDYSEYTIVDQSYLVVRVSENEIKAYSNHCRHRGNELANGRGAFRTGEIVCSFHGWRWKLDGTNSNVYAPQGFTPACLDPERTRLAEVQVGTFMGMVWINPDLTAPSLEEHLGPVIAKWAPVRLGQMKTVWWRYMQVPANWKTMIEPFMEAYHVAQTHPELGSHLSVDKVTPEWAGNDVYEVVENGSGWQSMSPATINVPPPIDGISPADYIYNSMIGLADGIDSALLQQWQVDILKNAYASRGQRGDEFLGTYHQQMYAEAERRGMPIPPLAEGAGSGYGFIFPNIVITAFYGNAFIQRVRPDGTDPEKVITEWWAVSLPTPEHKPRKPKLEGPLEYEDWGFVVQQDLSNIEKLQRGVRSQAMGDVYFSVKYEQLILNFHRAIESYLDPNRR